MLEASVLLVSPLAEDHDAIRSIIDGSPWNLTVAECCPDAWRKLHEDNIAAVLTEAEFPDGLTWRDLLHEISEMNPSCPVIVISRVADNALWAEVLNLGGYDLLMKPFERREVLHVLEFACREKSDQARVASP